LDLKNTESVERLRAKTILEIGRTRFNADRYEEALAAFEEAIAADPTFLRARTAKAHALKMLGRAREAVEVCEDVIAREPGYALAHSTLGSALQTVGRAREALAAYRRAEELSPDDRLVHYNFACFWAGEGNEEECRKHLTRTLELDATQKSKAAVDQDFAAFRDKQWFQDLVALR
jgi:tetratricopeptide (TPR) repeat protein